MLKIHNGNILFLTLIASALGFMAGLSAKNAPPSMSVSPLTEAIPLSERIAEVENLLTTIKNKEQAGRLGELFVSLAKEKNSDQLKSKVIQKFKEITQAFKAFDENVALFLYYAIRQSILSEQKIWMNLSNDEFDWILYLTVSVVWQETKLIDEPENILKILRQLNELTKTNKRRRYLLDLDCAISLRKVDVNMLPKTLDRLIAEHETIASSVNLEDNEQILYWVRMLARFWDKGYPYKLLIDVARDDVQKFTKAIVYTSWASFCNLEFSEMSIEDIDSGLQILKNFIQDEKIKNESILYKQYNYLKQKLAEWKTP